MGSVLPVLSGKEVVRIFGRLGWQVARQKASHIILVKSGEIATLSVPDHKEVARGTLRSLIRDANLSVHDFLKAAK
ncbi:MAG: type II toxin-antitoxin system HicA family toxin [Tepidisphaeraceae bacterium]|jgi:predicted RNA binding protein YcfA (HicA-like mRNA interferase family)